MARLAQRSETYFTTVRGMCRTCRRVVPARVFFREGAVWQQSLCAEHPGEPARIAGDADWYLSSVLQPADDHAPLPGAHRPRRGCPHDCGPCTWHASRCQLPVVSITNACNLRCPICFTHNRRDRIYHMPADELRATVDWIVSSAGRVDLINLTGGEPTLHPDLIELLAVCRRPEIGRITLNSNGLRLAEDEPLCRRLADLDVCVVLSLSTLDSRVSRRMHGRDVTAAKLAALDNLTRAGVRVTLLAVLVRGLNEGDLAPLLELLATRDNVLSLTVQTMTYTGQGGGVFPRAQHVPVDDAAEMIARASGGSIARDDFVTRPSAHPLCYLICYLLKDGTSLVPLTRLAERQRIRQHLGGSYLLRAGQSDELFVEAVNRLYAEGRTEHLAALRRLIERLYPAGRALSDFQRQRAAESAVRTVYLHAHMDEDTFDCARAMRCPDLVPAEAGRLIPACTYNLFYRMADERFYAPVEAAAAPTEEPQHAR